MGKVLIFPEIFEGDPVKAFFTGKEPGADLARVADIGRIKKELIYTPIQRHTSEVIIIGSEPLPPPLIGDAVITGRKGIMLGIQVADCVPVLLFDRVKRVISAVHAGWRGTASGILIKTIMTMKERFSCNPLDLVIAMGPSIRWCCYKVGSEVIEAVTRITGEGEYILQRDVQYCLDLPSANRQQALKMGVPGENIWISEFCTFCEHERFYSYRFSKAETGRQGGFIHNMLS